jgi:hypothetical protein
MWNQNRKYLQMVNNYSKCKKGDTMNKNNCDIINLSHWFLDLISNIMDCNCKK